VLGECEVSDQVLANGLAFALGMGISWLIIAWVVPRVFRPVPLEDRRHAHLIFRVVKREDRAAYVRIMRRSTAVAMRDMQRDLNRAVRTFQLEIGKALLPAFERIAAKLRESAK
jgi:hypothetical protein